MEVSLRASGKIKKYVRPARTGWVQLDGTAATQQIVATRGRLYQRHTDGSVYKYVGGAAPWKQIDANPATAAIVAGGGELFQLRSIGLIWKNTGR